MTMFWADILCVGVPLSCQSIYQSSIDGNSSWASWAHGKGISNLCLVTLASATIIVAYIIFILYCLWRLQFYLIHDRNNEFEVIGSLIHGLYLHQTCKTAHILIIVILFPDS